MGQKLQNQSSQSSSTTGALDDLSYDLVTVLYEKSKALEAYDQYLDDAASNEEARNLLQQLRQQDVEAVGKLRTLLVNCFNGGQQGRMGQDEASNSQPSRAM